MNGLIGPRILGVPYIILADLRDGYRYFVPDVPNFTNDHVSIVRLVLKPLGYEYTCWARYVRIMRETLAPLTSFVSSVSTLPKEPGDELVAACHVSRAPKPPAHSSRSTGAIVEAGR